MADIQSLRGRLLRWLIGSLSLLLAAGFVSLYLLQSRLLVNEFDRQAFEKSGRAVRDIFRHGAENVELSDDVVFIHWFRDDGAADSWSVPAESAAFIAELEIPEQKPGERFVRFDTVLPDGKSVRIYVNRFGYMPRRGDGPNAAEAKTSGDGPPQPPPNDGAADKSTDNNSETADQDGQRRTRRRTPPQGTMVVALSRTALDAKLRNWMTVLIVCCLAGELLVVMAVLGAVRRALTSLKLTAQQISTIDSKSLSSRVSTRNIDSELMPVVSQVNSLLERLEAAFGREQTFTANAAHELRTPLAGMRTQLEVLLRRDRSSDEYIAAVKTSLEAVKSMHAMIDAMLELARLDSASELSNTQIADLADITKVLVSRYSDTAAERGCEFELEIAENIQKVNCDVSLLETVIANLLANAAEYCDSGKKIEVSLKSVSDASNAAASGKKICLSVSNPAAELNAEDVSNIFDRLWRKDKARSQAASHCGLGLSIVKRCCELLGAEITTKIVHGHVSFEVRFAVG